MLTVEQWPTERLTPYIRNPRKNDGAVDKMCAAIREFGFRIPVVARSDGTVVDGHLRLKAAQRLGLAEVPVALAEHVITAFTDEGGICFEPFSGSGTTIIAGQQTGRAVRAIDLAPTYVDVALRRWSLLHPDIPPMLDGDGRTYDEIAAERVKEASPKADCVIKPCRSSAAR